jgi:gliding motility-associated-like protein
LPASCNGTSIAVSGNYKLYLSGYVDNVISDVYVNGVATGINGGNYVPGGQLDMTLNGPWVTGWNYVDVLVYNYPGAYLNPYGLLLVANYSATLNSDLDGDGVVDLYDLCPCQPGAAPNGCCPLEPTGNTTQTFCNSARISDLVANGTSIQWYSDSTTTISLNPNTNLVTGTYYASQTVSGCTFSPRLLVNVIINQPPLPVASQNQTICNYGTIEDLIVSGSNINYFSNQVGGTPLSLLQPLVNNTTYYLSQTVNNCESARIAINVIVNTPIAPSGSSVQTFCNQAIISDLNVSGSTIEWFSQPTNGVLLFNNTPLQNQTYYYAAQVINGCKSLNRLPVLVAINECDINIYNFVSVDNDGINEIFTIDGITFYPDNDVQIFNRWGILVFEINGYNNADKSFSGRSEGRVTADKNSNLPEGTYYYIVKYTKPRSGVGVEKTGYLYLTY